MVRYWLRRFVIAAAIVFGLLLCLLVALVIWFELTTEHTGIAQTPEQSEIKNLPGDATDVRWRLPHILEPNTLYSFSTSREGFEKWVKDKTFAELQGPQLGPASILTYDPESNDYVVREFASAILYDWHEEDMGVEMLYDLAGKRAYYFSHTR